MHQVERYHDICAGHRVVGHEGKCRHLHGHNYRIHFTCEVDPRRSEQLGLPLKAIELDDLGRVIDFSVVKDKLCMWLEDNWDHKFLHWDKDPLFGMLHKCITKMDDMFYTSEADQFTESLVMVPFNPTAENMAQYLVEQVAPKQLEDLGVIVTKVRIEETRKCSVTYEISK